jgi:hypothetical protein
MRRVSVDSIRGGDRVGKDVYTRHDMPPLLKRGARISDGFRIALERAGVTSLWIEDDLSEGIVPLEALSEETRDDAIASIRTLFGERSDTRSSGTVSEERVDQMRDIARRVVADVCANGHCALALNDLANADGYTMRHSLAVTVLGLALGLRVIQKFGGWIFAAPASTATSTSG